MTSVAILLVLLVARSLQAPLASETRDRALALGRDYVYDARHQVPPAPFDAEREEAVLKTRRRAIEAELATLGEHPWAGWYYEGDGLGHNVRLGIAPVAGATYTLSGCLGLYDLNHGEIRSVDARGIELYLVIDPRQNDRTWRASLPRATMSSRWVPVSWGTERFLIPECQLIAFCNDVNSGGDGGNFPRREADGAQHEPRHRPEGMPALPSAYAPFLLERELEAALEGTREPLSVGTYAGGSPEKFLVTAEIPLGTEQGLLPGMLFHAPAEKRGEAEVVHVEPGRALLEFRFAKHDEARDIPRDGWRVTTRKPARRTR
ncbi:MAG: hypothetical protein ABL998_21250 [Planctomycetota bacterium]